MKFYTEEIKRLLVDAVEGRGDRGILSDRTTGKTTALIQVVLERIEKASKKVLVVAYSDEIAKHLRHNIILQMAEDGHNGNLIYTPPGTISAARLREEIAFDHANYDEVFVDEFTIVGKRELDILKAIYPIVVGVGTRDNAPRAICL